MLSTEKADYIKLHIEELTSQSFMGEIGFEYDEPFDFELVTDSAFSDESYFLDVDLSAHLDSLLDAGFETSVIEQMNGARYGNCLDLYYIIDLNCYIMHIVSR